MTAKPSQRETIARLMAQQSVRETVENAQIAAAMAAPPPTENEAREMEEFVDRLYAPPSRPTPEIVTVVFDRSAEGKPRLH